MEFFLVLILISLCAVVLWDRVKSRRQFERIDRMIEGFPDLFPYNPNDQ